MAKWTPQQVRGDIERVRGDIPYSRGVAYYTLCHPALVAGSMYLVEKFLDNNIINEQNLPN